MKSRDRKRCGTHRSNYRKKRNWAELESGNGEPASAGRPNCLDRETLGKLLEAYYSHPYSFRELAGMFGVSRMTVWRAVQEPSAMGWGR